MKNSESSPKSGPIESALGSTSQVPGSVVGQNLLITPKPILGLETFNQPYVAPKTPQVKIDKAAI